MTRMLRPFLGFTQQQEAEDIGRHFGLSVATVAELDDLRYRQLRDSTPLSAVDTPFRVNGIPVSTRGARIALRQWMGAGYSEE